MDPIKIKGIETQIKLPFSIINYRWSSSGKFPGGGGYFLEEVKNWDEVGSIGGTSPLLSFYLKLSAISEQLPIA
jgi:hypothetical protein